MLKKITNRLWVYRLGLSGSQLRAISELKLRLNNNAFEYVNCPFCDRKQKFTILRSDCYGLPSDFSLCTYCAGVYTSRRIKKADMMNVYAMEYRAIDRPSFDIEDFFLRQKVKGQNIFKYISDLKTLKPNSLIVEIGCGAGGILSVFKEAGHDVLGVDYNETFLQYSPETSKELYVGGIDKVKQILGTRKPDVIIYEQVFEHLYNLKDEISKISELMNENSILYIGVPGFSNIHSHYLGNYTKFFQVFHLVHFTPFSLSFLLKSEGFEVLELDSSIRSVSRKSEESRGVSSSRHPVRVFLLLTYIQLLRIQKFTVSCIVKTLNRSS